MAQDYSSFLKGKVDPHEIKVFSASTEPAQSSARAFLLGLAPNLHHTTLTSPKTKNLLPPFEGLSATSTSNSSLLTAGKPFPMSIESIQNDFMFLPEIKEACPKAAVEFKNDSASFMLTLETLADKMGPLLANKGIKASKYFGEGSWNPELLARLYDVVHAYEHEKGKEIEGIDEQLYFRLRKFKGLYTMAQYFTVQEESRVYSHSIFSEILEGMSNIVFDEDSKIQFSVFSATAKSLIAMLMALKLTSFDCLLKTLEDNFESNSCQDYPEFASSLNFELAREQKSGEMYIQLRYNGNKVLFSDQKGSEISLSYFPYETMVDLLAERTLLPNFKQFCGNDVFNAENEAFYRDWLPYAFYLKIWLIFINFIFLLVLCERTCFQTYKAKQEAIQLYRDIEGKQDEEKGELKAYNQHKFKKEKAENIDIDYSQYETNNNNNFDMNQFTEPDRMMTTERNEIEPNNNTNFEKNYLDEKKQNIENIEDQQTEDNGGRFSFSDDNDDEEEKEKQKDEAISLDTDNN